MKALVYTKVGALELQEVPEPEVGPGEVLVRVSLTGICGSDVHGFLGHSARRQPGLVLGHETLGVVQDGDPELAGRRVSVNPLIGCGTCRACRAGRQNVCSTWRLLGLDRTQGGFAEWVSVPRRNVIPLPDHVSDAAAVMIEPLANAIHLLAKAPREARPFPKTALLGGGTLGACILSVALLQGFEVVLVAEPNPRRAEVARALGAQQVCGGQEQEVMDILATACPGGVDVAVDAVGKQATRQLSARALCRGGTALLLGLDDGPTSFDFHDLIRREVRLQTSFAYTESDFQAAFDLVDQRRVDFEEWTDVVSIVSGQAAFDKLVRDPEDRLKIALRP